MFLVHSTAIRSTFSSHLYHLPLTLRIRPLGKSVKQLGESPYVAEHFSSRQTNTKSARLSVIPEDRSSASPVLVTGRPCSVVTQVIGSCMFLVGLSGLSGSGALLALSQRAEEEDRSCWKVEVGLVHGGGGGGGIAACSKAASLAIIGAMACCTMLAKSVTVGSSGTMWFLSPRELGCCGLAGPRSSCRGAQGGALFG